MGHIIGRHHDENSAATVMFSVLTQVLFPAAALVKGLSAVLPTTAAGTAVAASTVSYLGATALRTTYREDHLREAEQIAFRLLSESGWDLYEVAEEARRVAVMGGDETWMTELRGSLATLDQLANGPRRGPFRVAPANGAAADSAIPPIVAKLAAAADNTAPAAAAAEPGNAGKGPAATAAKAKSVKAPAAKPAKKAQKAKRRAKRAVR
jgi:hypothetical protein